MIAIAEPALVHKGTPKRLSRHVRGFTLIEVLVAIALVALLAGMVVAGSGMVGSARLRQAAGLLVSTIRMANNRATAISKPMRVVFNLDAHTVDVEQSEDVMLRVKESNDRKETEGTSAGAQAANEAEQKAVEYADSLVKGPHAKRAAFKSIPNFSDDPQGKPIGGGIRFNTVQTEHDLKARKEGRVYLYFWPGGQTERAAIQINRGEADPKGVTILVNPLTGKARVERGQVELDDLKYQSDFGTRDEE